MPIDPKLVTSLIRLAQFGLSVSERVQDDQMTDEEFKQHLAEMQANLDDANTRWEQAKQSTTADS